MKREFVVRKARLKDVDAIVEMNTQLLRHHSRFEKLYLLSSKEKRVKAMRQNARQRIKSKNSLALVAEESGQIAGYLTASIKNKPEYFKANKWGHIHQLYVKPKHRKKGIAKTLFNEAIKFFRKKGAKWLEVEASVKNLSTKKTYKALGLRDFETIMVKKV
jgi:ribosomal protein S18 acetylase RimI-like enzyme